MPNAPVHNGMTELERRIMRLWDDGHSTRRIARIVGLPAKRTANVVSRLEEGNETRLARENTARGSAKLLAALQATPPQQPVARSEARA